MAQTDKRMTDRDADQATRKAFNDETATLGVDGFLAGKVGHKIELAISTTTIANDTETYTYSDDGVTVMVLKIVYTDGARTTMLSAERIG
jgi:hypothetical protein